MVVTASNLCDFCVRRSTAFSFAVKSLLPVRYVSVPASHSRYLNDNALCCTSQNISQNILAQSTQEYGLEEKYFSQDAKEQLLSYGWPGNIRELISVVQRAAILSDGCEITPEALFLESRGLR